MKRLGLLGGSFNPPHLGHLICAQEAHSQLELDRVLLMPVANPPHKLAPSDPIAEHRIEMCRRAVGDDRRLEVSRVEVERGGRSYTVDTLRELRSRGPTDQLTLIVGADMAETLPQWHEPEAILELAVVGVAARGDASREQVLGAVGSLDPERLRFFEMPRIDVSSSLVRERVAAGRPIRYLVADQVERYIRSEQLYRAQPSPVPEVMSR